MNHSITIVSSKPLHSHNQSPHLCTIAIVKNSRKQPGRHWTSILCRNHTPRCQTMCWQCGGGSRAISEKVMKTSPIRRVGPFGSRPWNLGRLLPVLFLYLICGAKNHGVSWTPAMHTTASEHPGTWAAPQRNESSVGLDAKWSPDLSHKGRVPKYWDQTSLWWFEGKRYHLECNATTPVYLSPVCCGGQKKQKNWCHASPRNPHGVSPEQSPVDASNDRTEIEAPLSLQTSKKTSALERSPPSQPSAISSPKRKVTATSSQKDHKWVDQNFRSRKQAMIAGPVGYTAGFAPSNSRSSKHHGRQDQPSIHKCMSP